MSRPTLAACVITFNEEERLAQCLASLAFCDEIVVVDSESTDRTVAIARAAGARVTVRPWPGFAAQRNAAIDLARADWVLEVDADERVTADLAAEIRRFVDDPPDDVDLGALPIRHRFLGRDLGPSAQYPAYRRRLVRRGRLRHDERRLVHEGFAQGERVHGFAGDLTHRLADTWGEALGDLGRYARLEAAQAPPGRPSPAAVAVGLLGRPLAKAAVRLTLFEGWRDGWRGAAKVGLDAGSDALVWWHRLTAPSRRDADRPEPIRPLTAQTPDEVRPGSPWGHFGLSVARGGPVRLVAVAAPREAAAAAAWCVEAAAAGADTTLVTTAIPRVVEAVAGAGGLRVRRPRGLGPTNLARALAVEQQLRPIDALVARGRVGAVLARTPRPLRGGAATVVRPAAGGPALAIAAARTTRGAPTAEGAACPDPVASR